MLAHTGPGTGLAATRVSPRAGVEPDDSWPPRPARTRAGAQPAPAARDPAGERRPPRRGRLAVLTAAALALVVLAGALLLHRSHNRNDPLSSASGLAPASAPAGATPAGQARGRPGGAARTAGGPDGLPGGGLAGAPPQASPAATSPAPTAPVVILNASAVKGLGEVAARRVAAAGFTVDRVVAYPAVPNIAVTTVFYGNGLRPAALHLQGSVAGIVDIRAFTAADSKLAEAGKLVLVVYPDFATPE
jgi:hypothetical protein